MDLVMHFRMVNHLLGAFLVDKVAGRLQYILGFLVVLVAGYRAKRETQCVEMSTIHFTARTGCYPRSQYPR
jgi:hypothetical protein